MTAARQDGKHQLAYGTRIIEYNLLYRDRKTMEIAVHPDADVIIKAPRDFDFAFIENKILKRAGWILRKQNYFRSLNPRTPPRHYVGGETHLYLGRQYRLKLIKAEEESVKLSKGYLYITHKNKSSPSLIKALLQEWYTDKAKLQFAECMNRSWKKFEKYGYKRPSLRIRWMKRRWGSLTAKNIATLNTDLIRTPKQCIEYVIIHELCHLKHRNHGPEFYKLLASILPNWKKLKTDLERCTV